MLVVSESYQSNKIASVSNQLADGRLKWGGGVLGGSESVEEVQGYSVSWESNKSLDKLANPKNRN